MALKCRKTWPRFCLVSVRETEVTYIWLPLPHHSNCSPSKMIALVCRSGLTGTALCLWHDVVWGNRKTHSMCIRLSGPCSVSPILAWRDLGIYQTRINIQRWVSGLKRRYHLYMYIWKGPSCTIFSSKTTSLKSHSSLLSTVLRGNLSELPTWCSCGFLVNCDGLHIQGSDAKQTQRPFNSLSSKSSCLRTKSCEGCIEI